jgi:hypothetical protein
LDIDLIGLLVNFLQKLSHLCGLASHWQQLSGMRLNLRGLPGILVDAMHYCPDRLAEVNIQAR